MTGKTIGIIVIVLIVIAGAWYFLAGSGPDGATPTGSGTVSATPTADGVTVDYTSQGFSPSTVTVVDGDSVTWTNDSSENLWVASDPHPLHNGYDGTTLAQHCAAGYSGPIPFDSCMMVAPGASWTFIFNQVGTWGYHNHADESMEGTVIVTAAATSTDTTATTSASVNVNI
jgi:plastocyanin